MRNMFSSTNTAAYRSNTMCDVGICGICKYCFLIFIYIYGFCHITFEVIQTIVPIGFILIGLASIGFYIIKIPPPDEDIVQTVIGRCLRDETDCPSDTPIYYMKTVAHRGAGLDAPENSLIAFDMCFKKGCTAIEFDVCLTADDVPVVFHDDSLERMTDLNKKISQCTWEELSTIDISVKHPYKDKFVNTNIPTLNQTVEQLLKCGQHMFIDIKTDKGKIINLILDLYEQYPDLYSKAVVSSFYPNVIYYIRRGNPKIVCSLAWRPNCYANTSYSALTGPGERRAKFLGTHYFYCLLDMLHEWFLTRLTYNILGVSLILLHKDVISPKVIRDWHSKGVRVVAWTVNHPVDKQYFARTLKITYMTDTWTGENTVHSSQG